MAYIDQSSAFGYGSKLTSTQMQNLRDNMDAAFAGDEGAPELAQGGLKTSTGEVSIHLIEPDSSKTEKILLPGGEYGFYPQTKHEQASWGFVYTHGHTANLAIVGSDTYQTLIQLHISQVDHLDQNSTAVWARQRYITSSGEVFWIFLLRDKDTKKVIASWSSPDHPCFGNTNDPNIVKHPFPGYNSDKCEIVVINPTTDEVQEIDDLRNYVYGMPKKTFMTATFDNYDIDEVADVKWPSREVTVGLNRERTSSIKAKIPKPKNIKQAKLVKK